MDAIDRAQAAVKRIRTTPGGFVKPISFTSPDGLSTAVINGMVSKIHMTTDQDGLTVNTKRPHISISESALVDLGYPTRNSNNECSLKDHKVSVVDSTKVICNYVISEVFPDETLGLIVCFLRDFK